ncbi:PREDICTED: uncharacterized protein LOC100639070 [Amphimedon queenslandica]|uniref:Death domain-containing protein n=1 Tax=Amphimedon queenslandica TaxID=400682 RepID=A0A1X7UE48_AMPQE|nr:PREDICTED: uncharacterized protein LOC100639070 [Amphimedon queenslandica]|eukprot:XP_019854935.1 PREDICTED: uncharacterized protein LOC100639070 [Amphimedon queenslandica]
MSLKITITSKHTLHLINRYTHIEVYFTGPTQHCPLVRKLLTTAIDNSSDAMHLKHNYVNAFACPYNESCYCIVNEDDCTVCGKPTDISNDYSIWFNDAQGPVESNNGTQKQVNDQSPAENPLLDKIPETDDLMKLFIDSAVHYMIIGIGLSVNVTDLTPLPHLTILNLIQVFQRWSDSNNDVTWAKILKVCQNFPNQLGKVEADINKFLLSPEARDKYLKCDK